MCAIEALPDASGDENQLKRIYNRWFHALGSVFSRRLRGVHEQRGDIIATVNVSVPNVSCCQWIITLSLSHDVGECILTLACDFSIKNDSNNRKIPQKNHTRAQHSQMSSHSDADSP